MTAAPCRGNTWRVVASRTRRAIPPSCFRPSADVRGMWVCGCRCMQRPSTDLAEAEEAMRWPGPPREHLAGLQAGDDAGQVTVACQDLPDDGAGGVDGHAGDHAAMQ